MQRVSPFIQLYLKDKEPSLPAAQRKELETLKTDAETYYKKIVKQTPAEIIAKRDEFNRRFEEIQKKIPENFEDLKESFQDSAQAPTTLLQGIEKNRFATYEAQVNQKEKADENTFKFSRLFARVQEYFSIGFSTLWPLFFGTVFAMIVANDAIGRPVYYRIFYFIFMLIMFNFSLIQGVIPIAAFLYYVYRILSSITSWSFTSGVTIDWVKAPVLFAFLPLIESQTVPWYLRIFSYNVNSYNGLAQKKKLAYEERAALLVGKEFIPKTLEEKFSQIIQTAQTLLTNVPRGTLEEAVEGIKKQMD
jgi:hypothetical protein